MIGSGACPVGTPHGCVGGSSNKSKKLENFFEEDVRSTLRIIMMVPTLPTYLPRGEESEGERQKQQKEQKQQQQAASSTSSIIYFSTTTIPNKMVDDTNTRHGNETAAAKADEENNATGGDGTIAIAAMIEELKTAAENGDKRAMKKLFDAYIKKDITSKEYETTLRTHQALEEKGKICSLQIGCCFVAFMGKHCSGNEGDLKHWIKNAYGGMTVCMDVKAKEGGMAFLKRMKNADDKMSIADWKKAFNAKGNDEIIRKVRKDFHLRHLKRDLLLDGNDEEAFKREVLDKVVDQTVDEDDPLMPLRFENGESCSSGGHSQKTECLLRKIPFFSRWYTKMGEDFEIIQTWCRASEDGSHDKHNDSFSKGATHRIILSINFHGKMMYFGY
jgi:hypothetical protein